MVREQPACTEQISLLEGVTGGNEHVFGRDLIAYGKHGLQQGLVEIVAQTSHLAGRSHVHAQHRVGLLKPGERELGSLDTYIVQVERTLVRRDRLLAEHDLGSKLYEIDLKHL